MRLMGEHQGSRAGKNVKPGGWRRVLAVMMSSGNDMALVLMTLQQLWLPAQDLHKIKPAKWGIDRVKWCSDPTNLGAIRS